MDWFFYKSVDDESIHAKLFEGMHSSLDQNSQQFQALLEQYKIVHEDVRSTTELREKSNDFWKAVNGFGIVAVSYLKQTTGLSVENRSFLLWILVFLGIFLSANWILSLRSFKKIIDMNYRILLEFEIYFPAKVFTARSHLSGWPSTNLSITIKELTVPILILMGYIILGFVLYIFPMDVAISTIPSA